LAISLITPKLFSEVADGVTRNGYGYGPATDRPNLTHRATSGLHHLDSTRYPASTVRISPEKPASRQEIKH
jgi:hypothetical protein